MPGELLASVGDINAHLPIGKGEITDAEDDILQVEAYRLVRAKLASTFAVTTLNGWVSPATTPDIIRTIAGMVIAAKWYAELYAEDSDEDATYAQNLYNMALGLIEAIRTGDTRVIAVDGLTLIPSITSSALDTLDFFPSDDAPVFTMGKEFA